MNQVVVKIIKLEPMRLISAYGFSSQPEGIAWEKLITFATKHGLYDEGNPPSTLGFNNPDPSEGSPNYGYEIWLPVDETIQPEGDLRLVNFPGGLYAVTKFENLHEIGRFWGELVKWREASKYKQGHHQWLEELLTSPDIPPEKFIFNLYLPITE